MEALVKKLVEAWGPSGYEHHIRRLIQDEVAGLADEITVDPLGNLICRVGSGGPKVMISAHMDEIGLMALYQEPERRLSALHQHRRPAQHDPGRKSRPF